MARVPGKRSKSQNRSSLVQKVTFSVILSIIAFIVQIVCIILTWNLFCAVTASIILTPAISATYYFSFPVAAIIIANVVLHRLNRNYGYWPYALAFLLWWMIAACLLTSILPFFIDGPLALYCIQNHYP
jgi:hypothetical protein